MVRKVQMGHSTVVPHVSPEIHHGRVPQARVAFRPTTHRFVETEWSGT